VQVVAVALEDVVLLDANLDIQIARRSAVDPRSPLPLERMRMPSSMPAGIFTSSVLLFFTRPMPSQVVHGSGITWPLPRQVGHVCWIEKKPCCTRTEPWPPQLWQVFGLVPGLAPEPWQVSQFSQPGTRISDV